ncbi:hypothetical protein [Rubrimonas cliftonensis]|uniref:Uncharacterized protein n=1 Tax=Rubrimonas cliftonensis TaxID=89524 RepID=A0A1H4FAP9_9RHOB|nr:hypothetical protein [Rubrimonas cliftonensis]SEA94271.1 hypothetical protein SAMN05444370_12024 [Rubrimonas cliftonensis]
MTDAIAFALITLLIAQHPERPPEQALAPAVERPSASAPADAAGDDEAAPALRVALAGTTSTE